MLRRDAETREITHTVVMSSAPYDTFYAVRVERRAPDKGPTRRPIYLNTRDGFGSLRQARQFDTIESAEAHLRIRPDRDRYRFLVEFCTRERPRDTDDPTANFLQRLMDIPQPYRRSAYNWVRGRDVIELLQRQSQEVMERHRRFLLDYDIDIREKSPVVAMKPRRGRFNINTGGSPASAGPKQYCVPRSQRPSPAPEPLQLDTPASEDGENTDG